MALKGVRKYEKVEFIGQIIDGLEDFFAEKGIKLDNANDLMREAGYTEEEIENNDVVFFGENYDIVSNIIEEVLINWGVCNR